MNPRLVQCAALCILIAAPCVMGQPSEAGAWVFLAAGHNDPIMTGRKWFTDNRTTNMLRITAFNDDWSAIWITVDDQGLATVSHRFYSLIRMREDYWATNQIHTINVARLQGYLCELVETTNTVPFYVTNFPSRRVALPTNQLVWVSFRGGTNWVQRQYRDNTLPEALFDCFDLIPAVRDFPELNRRR